MRVYVYVCVCAGVWDREPVEWLVGVNAGENPVTQPPAMFHLKVDESFSFSMGKLLYSNRSYRSELNAGRDVFILIQKFLLTSSCQFSVGKALVKYVVLMRRDICFPSRVKLATVRLWIGTYIPRVRTLQTWGFHLNFYLMQWDQISSDTSCANSAFCRYCLDVFPPFHASRLVRRMSQCVIVVNFVTTGPLVCGCCSAGIDTRDVIIFNDMTPAFFTCSSAVSDSLCAQSKHEWPFSWHTQTQ